jgi:hypothetical protein
MLGSVMVWGGVCSTARTDLHVFPKGTMNSTLYVTDILEQYVVPFGPCPIYRGSVRIVSEYLYCFYAMVSLNPIENVGDESGLFSHLQLR